MSVNYVKYLAAQKSIERTLAKVAMLENEYKIARMAEIAEGKYNTRRPLAKSNILSKQMRIQINIARRRQADYNKSADPHMLMNLVGDIIMNEAVFVHAKVLFEDIEKHSAATIAGREEIIPNPENYFKSRIEQPKSPYEDDVEVQRLIAKIKAETTMQKEQEKENE